jgi:hypothetical protein
MFAQAGTHTHTHTHIQVHMHHTVTGIQTHGLSVWAGEVPLLLIHYILLWNVSSNIWCSLVSRLHYSDETCKVQNVYSGVHTHNVNCLGINSDINITTIIIIIKHEAKTYSAWIRKCSDSGTFLTRAVISADSGGMWFIFQVGHLCNMI